MRVDSHPAYLLHRRKYRETSAILEVLSANYGRVNCVLKGAYSERKNNPVRVVQAFQPLLIGWVGKSELPTVVNYDANGDPWPLVGSALYCGMYVNELVVRLVGRSEANPTLFSLYESVLADLANSDVALEQTLRRFEKYLLQLCGYGLLLDHEGESGNPIDADERYYYHVEHGPERDKNAPDDVEVSGATLLKLANDEYLKSDELQQAKRLMRRVLSRYLGEKPLAARSLFE